MLTYTKYSVKMQNEEIYMKKNLIFRLLLCIATVFCAIGLVACDKDKPYYGTYYGALGLNDKVVIDKTLIMNGKEIITSFFGGGLIPFYNVMSGLHLVNTIWAIILPAVFLPMPGNLVSTLRSLVCTAK